MLSGIYYDGLPLFSLLYIQGYYRVGNWKCPLLYEGDSSVIPKFMKFSQGTLALMNNSTMPRGAYFQIFKEIIPNSKFAVIIWFWNFLANIFQFLALRITLSKIFFNKSYFKLCFIVCANLLLLLEVDLTLCIFIWKHSNVAYGFTFQRVVRRIFINVT